MKLHPKSRWNEREISQFLAAANVPVRIAFSDSNNEPMICSLWYQYDGGTIWCASHKQAYLIQQLKRSNAVSFEVSSNDYPYKGVRGKATVELTQHNADGVLKNLITKYLGDSNSQLATWLLSRSDDEYVIRIVPTSLNSWDFSDRMQA